MSFLTPLYLAGALAIGLPILFHLFRRTPRGRQAFSSLMFLSPSPPRLTRRSRLENWPLLLLRALIVLLLALAFARPWARQAAQAEVDAALGRSLAILVDTSASMRRENLWQQAQDQVAAALKEAGPMDRVALIAFDAAATPLLDLSTWQQTPVAARNELAKAKLKETKLSWAETNLAAALTVAAETLEDAQTQANGPEKRQQPRHVILVSDMQQGSRLEALQAYQWPEGVTLEVRAVAPKGSTNAGLQLVEDAEAPWQSEPNQGPRIRVTNSADAAGDRFTVRWDDAGEPASGGAKPVELYVPPGQTRIARGPAPADPLLAHRLVLEGDDHPFDNVLHLVAPRQREVKVLYLGEDDRQDTKQLLYYVLPAFPETPWRKVEVVSRTAAEALAPSDAVDTALVLVTGPQSPERVTWLKKYLSAGGVALVALRDVSHAELLEGLTGATSLSLEESSDIHPSTKYVMLQSIDFQHPLFAPLADPRYNDFTKIHFWKYRKFDAKQLPAVRVLASFDSGDPALAEASVDKGRLYVLASTWQTSDSQLALSSKFVPLLHGLLNDENASDRLAQYAVGQRVNLGAAAAEAKPKLVLPNKQEVALTAEGGSWQFAGTSEPGVYTAELPGDSRQFAVNVSPLESKTAPLAVEELEKLGVRLRDSSRELSPEQAAALKRQMLAAELENRQKLWRWLIAVALVALFAETLWAGWLSRQGAATMPVTA